MASQTDLDRVVYAYLKKKNYKDAAATLQRESKAVTIEQFAELEARNTSLETGIINQVAAHDRGGTADEPEKIEEAYSSLNKWSSEGLDQYRAELYMVMYPIFIHCYIDLVVRYCKEEAIKFFEDHSVEHKQYHERELEELRGVTTPTHVSQSKFVSMFRTQKYTVTLCSYSWQLMLKYLEEHGFINILIIINQHLDIKIFSGKPKQKFEMLQSKFGEAHDEFKELNKKEIKWGMLKMEEVEDYYDDEEEEEDKEKEEKGKKDKEKEAIAAAVAAAGKSAGKAAAAKAAAAVAAAAAEDEESLEKKKKRERKRKRQESLQHGPEKEKRVPHPKIRGSELTLRIAQLKDIRKRVELGPEALPSVCLYTFFNAQERLISLEVSEDISMIAGGFSDSFIKIWSLTDKPLTALKAADKLKEIPIDHDTPLDTLKDPSTASPVKTLVGHCGPVYATSFSHDNQFLVSGSEDGTARLWDLNTFSNVAVYKGHMYPIWDVTFSPLGYYFATASHDRTARVWSTDRIFPQRILAGHLADVDCVRFHPNGNYIATGSTDRTCRLWQITTGECVRVFEGHADSVQCLAFTEDGRFLASGGDDCNVVLWDIAEGKRIKTYRGHDDVLLSVSFSGEGSLVVSAAADDTVRVWDATVSADELRDAIEGDEEDDDDDETAASGTNELAVFPTKGSDST